MNGQPEITISIGCEHCAWTYKVNGDGFQIVNLVRGVWMSHVLTEHPEHANTNDAHDIISDIVHGVNRDPK